VNVASWDGNAWIIEEAYHGESECVFTSLAVDVEGYPMVALVDDDSNELKVARKSAQGWAVDSVDEQAWAGLSSSLFVDENGYPHIAYSDYDWPYGITKYARWTGSWWQIDVIDVGRESGINNSLFVDEQGSAHLAYVDDYRIRYAVKEPSGWGISEVTGGDDDSHMSLVLASSGLPRIAFFAGPHLMYAAFDGVGWTFQTVDDQSVVGKYNSLILDSEGNPHISYGDTQYGDLKYAYHDGTVWHVELVESQGINGYGTSLALTQNDMPRIAFYGAYRLKVASKDQTGWEIETVDDEMWRGLFPSLELDPVGSPHIAYYDDINEDLRYAVWDGSTWQLSIVDSDGKTGLFCSLELDHDGYPRITYYDESNGDLRYAYVPNPSGNDGIAEKPDCPFALRLASESPASGPSRFLLTLPLPGELRVELFDLTGRRISLLSHGFMPSGVHQITWDGRIEHGALAPNGIYICSGTDGSARTNTRLVLVR
jgi:hypothetical protein